MNLSRINRQLRREATAHPVKAAVLGLLCLVALWFWAPLVWSWMDEDDPATTGSVVKGDALSVPTPSGDASTEPVTTQKAPETPKHPWCQLIQWMDSDPRTSATDPLLDRRDPFLAVQSETAGANPEEEPVETLVETPVEATPEDLGMVLSSTIIGSRRRMAQINGKSYVQGEVVKLDKDGQQFEFTLTAVHQRRIILNRNGEQFELTIPAPARSGRIELVVGGN